MKKMLKYYIGDKMKSILLIIKGFFIGLANVVPGVSGGTIALILGIYEKLINTISHFMKNIKENILFILPIGIGMILSILISSGIIDAAYKNYPLSTTLFFVGLVLGGIPFSYKKIKNKKNISNWLVFLMTFTLVIIMSLLNSNSLNSVTLNNLDMLGYIKLFLIGVIASGTMIIPGISGSLVLMLLGYYYPIIELIKELTHFNNLGNNLLIALVFGLGLIIGIIGFVKIIEFLFKKYENKTNYGVLGFICASVVAIPLSTFLKINYTFLPLELIVGLVLIVIGFIISSKLGDK